MHLGKDIAHLGELILCIIHRAETDLVCLVGSLIHDLLCFAQEVVFDAFQQGLSVRVVQVEGAAVEIRALRDVSG